MTSQLVRVTDLSSTHRRIIPLMDDRIYNAKATRKAMDSLHDHAATLPEAERALPDIPSPFAALGFDWDRTAEPKLGDLPPKPTKHTCKPLVRTYTRHPAAAPFDALEPGIPDPAERLRANRPATTAPTHDEMLTALREAEAALKRAQDDISRKDAEIAKLERWQVEKDKLLTKYQTLQQDHNTQLAAQVSATGMMHAKAKAAIARKNDAMREIEVLLSYVHFPLRTLYLIIRKRAIRTQAMAETARMRGEA